VTGMGDMTMYWRHKSSAFDVPLGIGVGLFGNATKSNNDTKCLQFTTFFQLIIIIIIIIIL